MLNLLRNPEFLDYQELLTKEIERLKNSLVYINTWESVLATQGRILGLEQARDLVKKKELTKLKDET